MIPHLIDNRIQDFISDTLNSCHTKRVAIYYYALNLGIIALFVLLGGLFFFLSYRNRPTKEQQHLRSIRDREHVLNQIRIYQQEQEKINSLTSLPLPQTERKRGEEDSTMRPLYIPRS